MVRTSAGLLLVAVLGLLPPGAARAGESPTAELARRAAEVRKKLAAPINFGGIDDPDTKFSEALELFHKVTDITFEVNEDAFRSEMIDDLDNKPLGRAVPKMSGVSAETALRRVLARIRSVCGAWFVVRGGVVEITTRHEASPSNWRSSQEPVRRPPEVSISFDKRELQDALREIADATGVNIVLDTRATDRGKTAVTATLRDVAVDTAIQILATMAELQVAVLDDVLCVTTKEGAKSLQKEQQKRRWAAALSADAQGQFGFQPPYNSQRIIEERDLKAKRKGKRQVEPKKEP
jgi:hypothetical protein